MSTGSRIALYAVALLVVVYLVRLLGAPWPHFPLSFPDSSSFLKVARRGPFHPKFYVDERPIGYPLLAWTVGRSPTLIVVAQTALYIGAFYALCRVLTRELSSRVIAVLAIVFLVAVAMESRNSMWNTLVLSESLSATAAVLSIAAWLRAASRPSPSTIRLAWLATVAWILVRDSNLVPALLVVVPALFITGALARRRSRPMARALITGAIAVTIACGYVYLSVGHSQRDITSFYDDIGMRVLPDPALTKWFAGKGMPLDAALQGRAGHNSWDNNEASFLQAPELARFRSWAKHSGPRVLGESLVLRAPDWWKRLHHDLPGILAYKLDAYDYFQVGQRLPSSPPAPLGEPRTTGGLTGGIVLAAVAIGVMVIDERRRLFAALCGVALVSAFVDLYVSYAGDAMEVQRHLVGPLLRLSVILIITIALGADSALRILRDGRARRLHPVAAEPAGPVLVAEGSDEDR